MLKLMLENIESVLIIMMIFGIVIISSIFLLFRNKRQIPDIITDLEIKPDNFNPKFSSAKLSWTPPNPNNSKIIEYQIKFQNTNETSWTTVVTCNSSHILPQLEKGETYRFRIAAKNTVGLSKFSEEQEKFFTSNILDSYQQDAVSFNHNTPLLITAGPGSGKTRVVSERVKDLILNQHVSPEKILCITFSKAGQREMQKRFDADIDFKNNNQKYPRKNIRTFHSLCLEYLGHPPVFELEKTNDNEPIRKYTIEGQGWIDYCKKNFFKFNFTHFPEKEDTIEQLIDGVSAFKKENITLDNLDDYLVENSCRGHNLEYDEKLADLYKYFKEYDKYLSKKNQNDFDDFLLKTSKKLENNDFKISIKNDIDYLIIDEFQDNNFLQFKIVKQLTSSQNITAVGDRNQSIYSFQGANIELFKDFEKNYPDFKSFHLKNNYRSSPQIIKITNNFLKRFESTFDNTFDTSNPDGPKVHVREFDNPAEELDYFFNLITSNVNLHLKRHSEPKERIKFSDFIILARTNAERLTIQQSLVRKGIPCRTKTFTRIEYSEGNVSPYVKNKQKQYGLNEDSLISEFLEKFEINYPLKIFTKLNLDFEESTLIDDDYYMDKILLSIILKFSEYRPDAKISEFLAYIEDPNQQKKKAQQYPKWDFINAVEIGTAHSVKGKEFSYVLVSSSNEKKFPLDPRERELKVPQNLLNYKSEFLETEDLSEKEIEDILHFQEESRLYYVAMTRAKFELFLTYSLMDKNKNELKPSRFLNFLMFKEPQTNLDYKKILSDFQNISTNSDVDSTNSDVDSTNSDVDSTNSDVDLLNSNKIQFPLPDSSPCVGMYFYDDLMNPDSFLNICSPWISSSIIEDLIKLSEKKIEIRIITWCDPSNLEQQKSISLLKNSKNNYLKYIITKNQIHNKYYIKDNDMAIFTTANFTKTSLWFVENGFTIYKELEAIKNQQNIFEKNWHNN